MREARYLVLLVAVGLIATGANAGALLVADGADETVTLSANASYDAYSAVGTSGGFSATGTLNVDAGVTVTFSGFEYIAQEDEMHAFDIGGQASGVVNLGAGATIITDYSMGVGQDGRWYGNANPAAPFGTYANSGYNATVNMAAGARLQDDYWAVMIGLGEVTNGGQTHITMEGGASISGVFMLGGTIEASGTVAIEGSNRYRSMGAAEHFYYPDPNIADWEDFGHVAKNRAYSDPLNEFAILKLTGTNPLITATGGFQLGILAKDANGDVIDVETPDVGHSFGPQVDLSEADIPEDQWYTILVGGNAGYWPLNQQSIELVPGSEGLIRCMNIGSYLDGKKRVEVWIPEPATMALLAIGGIGVLIRKKR